MERYSRSESEGRQATLETARTIQSERSQGMVCWLALRENALNASFGVPNVGFSGLLTPSQKAGGFAKRCLRQSNYQGEQIRPQQLARVCRFLRTLRLRKQTCEEQPKQEARKRFAWNLLQYTYFTIVTFGSRRAAEFLSRKMVALGWVRRIDAGASAS